MPRSLNSLVLRKTTVAEKERLITSLPNKSSHGHDQISNTMLKSLCTSISYTLEIIFNQSIHQGVFPEQMKWAEIIPLYKGKAHDLQVNFTLMMMSEVLEKIIYTRLYSFLKLNGSLFDSQYSFRMKWSYKNAMSELLGNLLLSHNKNIHSSSIFLNLSKAFDTLNHGVLLKKLEAYGICGLINEWFKSYLNNRSLVAKIPICQKRVTYSNHFI